MKQLLSLGIVAVFAMMACTSSSPTGNTGGTNTLTVTNATPGSGNGTVTNIVVVADENASAAPPSCPAGCPAVELVVTGDVGGGKIHLDILVLKSDNSLVNVEHKWGPAPLDLFNPAGFTDCDANGTVCDPAKGTASVAQKTVTFTGLPLTEAINASGNASTLTGTLYW